MGRRRLPTEVKELREEIRRQEKQIEKLLERNAVLSQNADQQFSASLRYEEMNEQIAWLENLLKLERSANVAAAGLAAKRTAQEQMAIEDADEILRHRFDENFFIGITRSWRDAEERSRTVQKCKSFEAQVRQLQEQLDQSQEENLKLVNQIAALRYEQEKAKENLQTNAHETAPRKAQETNQKANDLGPPNKGGRPSIRTQELCTKVLKTYACEKSIRKVAEKLDLSYSTVQRVIKAARETAAIGKQEL